MLFEFDIGFFDDRSDDGGAQVDRDAIGLLMVEGLHDPFAGGHHFIIHLAEFSHGSLHDNVVI